MKQNQLAPAVIDYLNGRPVYEVRGGAPETETLPVKMETVQKNIQDAVADAEKRVSDAIKKYESEVQETGKASAQTRDELKAIATEFEGMQKEVESLKTDRDKLLADRQTFRPGGSGHKSAGQLFTESDGWGQFCKGDRQKARKEYDEAIFVKNTITSLTGSPADVGDVIAPADRLGGIVGGAFRMLRFLDMVPMGTTSQGVVKYTRENTWVNSAAETQEDATKPSSTLTFEQVTEEVRTIAHILKASKQIMEDAPMLQTFIDVRMRHGLRNRLELQCIAGNGVGVNLQGILATAGATYTNVSSVSGDTNFDFANRMKQAVITSDYMPSAYLINPVDWGNMERKKDAEGRYIGQEGIISYLQNGLIPLLWGLPVILSNNVTSGTGICLSMDAIMLWMRQGATVEIFEQDDTNVQKNLLTIRAELRAAFTQFNVPAIQAGSWPE